MTIIFLNSIAKNTLRIINFILPLFMIKENEVK